ncbi:hybrid sensor histidine kinase/response regulator transcription factor [Flavobacterium undicola]|uniref:hybrid sensor histidine kinase/response regulator transcription factor n=1 Tax=Flavobacterium undicola TaxID=1932779 RepID=UPI001376696E|nr:hybrid sensor histidine kinase/response regulator transcription factor [Flavobacterium undicola]MBA0882698.1 response regulator [Flavobacterium undicola]
MNSNFRRYILLGLFLCFCVFLNAQQSFVFTSIDSKNGLSENRVRTILQLQDGRMVVITEGVTNIYDGTSFKYLHLEGNNISRLTGYSGFHHGYVDQEYVWIKDKGKLMLLDIKQERFVSKPDSVLFKMGIREPIADFFLDASQNYWVLTSSDKLLFRNAKNGKTSIFLKNVSTPNGSKDQLYDVAVIRQQLFLFYRNGLIVCYDLKTAKELYKTNSLSNENPTKYGNTLMVVQSENSLYQIRNGGGGIMLGYDIKKRTHTKILQTDYWLNTISVDSKGNLWVSCAIGLWLIDKNLKQKQFIPSFKLVDGTEVNTEASTLYNDSQGGLWIGTFNHGLLYYHPDRFKFKNVGKTFFGTQLKDIDVTCFEQTAQNTILVGTKKGLYSYSPKTSKLFIFRELPADVDCLSMTKDSQNRIWICTRNKGVYCLQNNQLKHIDGLGGNCRSIAEKPDGQFLVATSDGLANFNPVSGKFQSLQLTLNGEALGSVSQLIPFDKQSFLGRSNTGLFVYNYKMNNIRQPLKELLKNENQNYTAIFKDSRGIVWIGTQDGLSVWQPSKAELHTLFTDDGLVNNSIKGIVEDKQGLIWITTAGGVSRIAVNNKGKQLRFSIANFNHYDGVIENEFTPSATFASDKGQLLMGGVNGFNIIDLQKPWSFKQLQKPLFTGLMLFGTKVKSGESYDGNTILKNAIATTKSIALNYNQNFISVDFSALNYVNPTQTYYRYRLEGVDDNWREIVAQNGTGTATYTNLASGTYVLKVKAASNSREWSKEYAEISIVVNPPFWKTPIAYVLYLAIVLLLLYLSLSYYKKWTNQQLMRKNEEKLNQMKFSFFTNVSHEFRTPLTLIITPLESILKEIKETAIESRIKLVHRHALNLQHLVNQLLDFRRLEISGEKLNLTFGDLVDFVTQFEDLFGKLAQEKQIEFSIQSEKPESFMYFDKDKLYKVINNLLSNAFKFTPAGGTITVQLSQPMENQNLDFVQLKVIDSGSGISENDLPNVFNRFYQASTTQGGSGIGLHLVKEYVALHSGDIIVESEPNVKTVFAVTIPTNLVPQKIDFETLLVVPEDTIGNQIIATPSKKETLLVVEDNDDLRHFLVTELSHKYEVFEAADGEEGEHLALSKSLDLIVSDVMMPKVDGFELCKRIKSNVQTSHIPVILLTARTSEELKMTGYQSGADEYLAKPFNLEILLLRIDKLIAQKNQRQSTFSQKLEVNPKEITITSIDEQLIEKALGYMEKNMDNPDYSVQQFSQDLGMDRTVLYKKMQSITGLAPSEFIRSIRLKRAAQLLIQGQYPVAEVAEKVGFNTQKYFSKYFKEAFGVSPSKYAQNEKNADNELL